MMGLPRTGARRVRALVTGLVVVVAACGGNGETGNQGGTVVIASATDLDQANPLVSVDAWTSELLRYALFTPLIRYGPGLEYEPYLARSWEMLGDTGVVFHLRHDVKWHDGVPTTAEDVLFTYERARDPATGFPNGDYFSHWTGGEVIDSFTVRFSFEPHAEPLAGWPFTAIAPKHLLDSIPPEQLRQAAFNHDPVGNGPFRFVSQRANDRWVFERNPDFPEAMGGPPHLDRLVWRVVPDNAAQVTELRAGEADLALQARPEQVRDLADREGFRVVVKPSRRFLFITWNSTRPGLGDPRVRRGLAMAIDRRRILKGLRGGLGEIGVSPIMPFHWSYDDDLEPLPHDPDSAAALLGAAGIRDGDGDGRLELPDGRPFAIEIKIPAGLDYYRDVAEAVRGDLAELGVIVKTRATEATTLFADLTSPERNYDAALLGWSGDFRLDLHDTFHSEAEGRPFQFASYDNERVDSLMDMAGRETDRTRAIPLWREVQKILRDEQPWTILYYQTDAFPIRERVRGVDMDIRGALTTVADWWVEPAGAPEPQNGGEDGE